MNRDEDVSGDSLVGASGEAPGEPTQPIDTMNDDDDDDDDRDPRIAPLAVSGPTQARPEQGLDPVGLPLAPEPGSRDDPGFLGFVRRNIWTIGIIVGIAFVTLTRPFMIHRPDPLPVLLEVPAFTLIDETERPFAREDLTGKVWIVGFVFTRCPSSCPTLSAAMVKMQEHLGRSGLLEEVHLLTVTVDPDHDSPAILAEYADKIGADTDSWRFVTGPKADVHALVIDGFALAVGERREVSPGVYDIAHANRLALVDEQGRLRGLYSIDDEGLEELYHRALQAVRE